MATPSKRFCDLAATATEEDVNGSNYLPLSTPTIDKKVPANLFAKKSDIGLYPFIKSIFERGNINMSESSLAYQPSTSRARTKRDCPISLVEGDTLIANTNKRFYVAYSTDGNAPFVVKGWIKKFTAPSDIKVHLLLSNDTEETGDLNILTDGYYTTSTMSELNYCNVVKNYDDDVMKIPQALELEFNGLTGVSTNKIPCKAGMKFRFTLSKINWDYPTEVTDAQFIFVHRYYDADGVKTDNYNIHRNPTNNSLAVYYWECPENVESFDFFARGIEGESVGIKIDIVDNYWHDEPTQRNSRFKDIAHRGWTGNGTKENTLLAFQRAVLKGYEYVETDIQPTSDGVYVCYHNTTINDVATSSLTYEELNDLVGGDLLKFEDFVKFCSLSGIKPYIEIKNTSTISTEDASALHTLVKQYGILNDVSWIGTLEHLSRLRSLDTDESGARYGWVCGRSIDITNAATWMNDVAYHGRGFADVGISLMTDELYQLYITNNTELEFWTLNRDNVNLALKYPLATGLTTDNILAGRWVKKYVCG